MAYVPVASRKVEPKTGYVPVAERAPAVPAPTLTPSFSMGGQSTQAAILPPPKPEPNFQTLSGASTFAPAPNPKQLAKNLVPFNKTFVPNTTISQDTTPPSIFEKLTNALPPVLRSPVKLIATDIKEGLFGNERQKASVRQLEEQGQETDLPTLLSTTGILEYLGRSNTDKIAIRAKAHEDAGVDPARAASLAFYEVFGGVQATPGTEASKLAQQAKERYSALAPTGDEKNTAFWSDVGQAAGSLGDATNFVPFGAFTKSLKLAEALRILPDTAEGIAEAERLLKQAGVADDLAKSAAPKFAATADAKTIDEGLNTIERLQNSTKKVPYASVAERTASAGKAAVEAPKVNVIPKELEPLAAEASKYATAEEFKQNITPQQLRTYLNVTQSSDAKTASASATGAKKRLAGDYLYHQDRPAFDAQLDDIKTGRNPSYHQDLTDFYTQAKEVGAETDSLFKTADAAQAPTTDNLPPLPKATLSAEGKAALNPKGFEAMKSDIEVGRAQTELAEDAAKNAPGKGLRKYESRTTGQLPEVTGKATKESMAGGKKVVKAGKFTKEGDVVMQEMGFHTAEDAQKALDDYKVLREQAQASRAAVSKRVKDYHDRKAVYEEVKRYVNEQARDRRQKIQAVADFFHLTSEDLKQVMKGERNLILMSDEEFGKFMDRLEGKATEHYLRSQKLVELKATILDKEFVKLENLLQAMKLPSIDKMTAEQMQKLNEFLEPFKQGDEFLGVRQLETVKNTDLTGVYTRRQAQERLLKDVNETRARQGLQPVTMDDLSAVKEHWLDKFRYDVALARRNPMYELMVRETHKALLNTETVVLETRDRVDELFNAARASRKQGWLDKLIPSDRQIFNWLEAPDADKLQLAKDMTHEELEAAMYVREWYAEARDYLVQQNVLKKFISDYVTHVRRGFLEAWKEEGGSLAGAVSGERPGAVKRAGSGLLAAFKEAFSAYKQQEAFFNIMNDKTGNVLPLEKFFQFSMQRTGQLAPSKNVAKAFLKYVETFEKKKALDALIPKLDIYVHSLSPTKLTPRGLEMDDTLKQFFKRWMNTKKGRPTSLYLLRPGDTLDWALRTGTAIVRIMALGFNLPVALMSHFGAQTAAYRGLGEVGYAIGQARMQTESGRAIIQKYRNLVGEPLLGKYTRKNGTLEFVPGKALSAEGTLGDSLMSSLFGLFAQADRKSRQVFLLGSLTPEEMKTGEVSADRLVDIKLAMGRQMPIENMESIIGKTAFGKVATQFHSWAVPLMSSTLDDISKFTQAVLKKDREYLKTPEAAELLRSILITATASLAGYGVLSDKTPQKQKTFTEILAQKAAQDSLSVLGSVDPTMWLTSPPLLKFLFDLGNGLRQIVMIEKNKNGELTGVNTLERSLTPAAVRQLVPAETKTKKSGGGAGLPKLPKLPLPKLPKLPKI